MEMQMISRGARRGGFTLVEILVVIAIIGIIVGITIPVLAVALRRAESTAMAMEVKTIASALDRYQEKYGDYPPDGSNATAMTRHIRRIFPQISESELTIVAAHSNAFMLPGAVMDPPEALVFFLGGFSDDPIRPFTGPGGPLIATGNPALPYQYNISRKDPFYEFKPGQLSLSLHDLGGGMLATISNDESNFGFTAPAGFAGDVMPVYRPGGRNAPYVYFNATTYATPAGFNYYQSASIGTARPYKADGVNTASGASLGDTFYVYQGEGTYQVICAGLDDNYGGVPTASPTDTPLFFRFPSGDSLNIMQPINQPTTDRYTVPGAGVNFQLDNSTSFSDGETLESSMP